MKIKLLGIIFLATTISLFAQTQNKTTNIVTGNAKENASIKSVDAAKEMAKAVLLAHGGEKLKQVKTIIIAGSAEITSSEMPMPMDGTFVIVMAGEKGRFQLGTPFFSFTQVYADGKISSSMEGISIPPVSQTGFAVIPHFEDKDLVFIKDENGKSNTFSAEMPSGFTTNFEIDPKTNLVKGYRTAFELNGVQSKSAIAVDSYKNINGILLPEKFTQSFDFGQTTFYVKFKAKTLVVDTKVEDDVFVLK